MLSVFLSCFQIFGRSGRTFLCPHAQHFLSGVRGATWKIPIAMWNIIWKRCSQKSSNWTLLFRIEEVYFIFTPLWIFAVFADTILTLHILWEKLCSFKFNFNAAHGICSSFGICRRLNELITAWSVKHTRKTGFQTTSFQNDPVWGFYKLRRAGLSDDCLKIFQEHIDSM